MEPPVWQTSIADLRYQVNQGIFNFVGDGLDEDDFIIPWSPPTYYIHRQSSKTSTNKAAVSRTMSWTGSATDPRLSTTGGKWNIPRIGTVCSFPGIEYGLWRVSNTNYDITGNTIEVSLTFSQNVYDFRTLWSGEVSQSKIDENVPLIQSNWAADFMINDDGTVKAEYNTASTRYVTEGGRAIYVSVVQLMTNYAATADKFARTQIRKYLASSPIIASIDYSFVLSYFAKIDRGITVQFQATPVVDVTLTRPGYLETSKFLTNSVNFPCYVDRDEFLDIVTGESDNYLIRLPVDRFDDLLDEYTVVCMAPIEKAVAKPIETDTHTYTITSVTYQLQFKLVRFADPDLYQYRALNFEYAVDFAI